MDFQLSAPVAQYAACAVQVRSAALRFGQRFCASVLPDASPKRLPKAYAHRSAAADLYRTSSVLCYHSAAPKAHSALWSLDAAAYAAAPSKPRINCRSAQTVCATRRARRRVTEPCAELARGSLLQPARFRTQPCVRHRFRATAPLRRAEPSRHADECPYKRGPRGSSTAR